MCRLRLNNNLPPNILDLMTPEEVDNGGILDDDFLAQLDQNGDQDFLEIDDELFSDGSEIPEVFLPNDQPAFASSNFQFQEAAQEFILSAIPGIIGEDISSGNSATSVMQALDEVASGLENLNPVPLASTHNIGSQDEGEGEDGRDGQPEGDEAEQPGNTCHDDTDDIEKWLANEGFYDYGEHVVDEDDEDDEASIQSQECDIMETTRPPHWYYNGAEIIHDETTLPFWDEEVSEDYELFRREGNQPTPGLIEFILSVISQQPASAHRLLFYSYDNTGVSEIAVVRGDDTCY